MMTTQEIENRAVELKRAVANCCQATIEALISADAGLEKHKAVLVCAASGFRAGMGLMGATCGALVGAEMLLGVKQEGADLNSVKAVYKKFETLSGATICKDLKQKTASGEQRCSCENCVRHAVRAYLEEIEK